MFIDKFEMFCIDQIKFYADRVRSEKDSNIRWMLVCVLDELICVFSKYQKHKSV